MIPEVKNREMFDIWGSLYSEININICFVDEEKWFNTIFPKIINYYTDKNRYYHNIDHIKDMLNHLNKDFKENLSKKQIIILKLSIIFHDIIYDPTQKDNEKQSAEFAFEYLKDALVDDVTCNEVYDNILKTQYHLNVKPENHIQEILIDLDLRGFGTDTYWINGFLFRKEFSHLTDDEWFKGRIKFLENFIDSDIYQTELYRNKYEDKAKNYMKQELNNLKNKYG